MVWRYYLNIRNNTLTDNMLDEVVIKDEIINILVAARDTVSISPM